MMTVKPMPMATLDAILKSGSWKPHFIAHEGRTWGTAPGFMVWVDLSGDTLDKESDPGPFLRAMPVGEPWTPGEPERWLDDDKEEVAAYLMNGAYYDARYVAPVRETWPSATWTAPPGILTRRSLISRCAALARVEGLVVAVVAALRYEPESKRVT